MLSTSTICIVIAIVLYLAFMLYLGFRFAKGNTTTGDYYLGGRQLGPLVTAMSAEASDMSSWLLMGLPGVAYATGICDAGWTAIGLGVGTYLNWLLTAKRLRHYSEVIGALTIPEFFEKRFHDRSHLLMGISAFVIVFFFIPYTASGFAACGKLFSSLFRIDYLPAMVVSALVIIVYTASGGFMAASTTDFFQSIVMTFALIAVVCYGLSQTGGWNATMSYAGSLPGYLSMTEMYDAASGSASSYGGILTIVSTAAWGLGYFGMPHILLRFMAIEDPDKITLSRRVASVWVFISMFVAIFIGVLGLSMVHAGALEPLEDPERIIIIIADKIAHLGIVPGLLAGVILAGILACTMSTCDSQLLAASSSISEDIFHGVFNVKVDEKTTMRMARGTLIVIAILGVVMARDPNSSVFGIVSFAWAGFGAAFGPVMMCAIFWRRTNFWGALIGMVSGGTMMLVWHYMIKPMGGVFGLYELLPGFLVGLVGCIIASLSTSEPEAEILAEFDKVDELCRK
jgi:sodium/proline symporter